MRSSRSCCTRDVNLFFLFGADVADPHTLLQGSGSRVRRIRLDDASVLDQPAVKALVADAGAAEN